MLRKARPRFEPISEQRQYCRSLTVQNLVPGHSIWLPYSPNLWRTVRRYMPQGLPYGEWARWGIVNLIGLRNARRGEILRQQPQRSKLELAFSKQRWSKPMLSRTSTMRGNCLPMPCHVCDSNERWLWSARLFSGPSWETAFMRLRLGFPNTGLRGDASTPSWWNLFYLLYPTYRASTDEKTQSSATLTRRFLPSPTFNKKGTSSDTALIISRLGTEIEDIEEDRGITLRRIRWTALVFPDSRSSFVSEPRAQSMCLMLSHDPRSVTPSLHVICLRQNTIGSEKSTFGRIKVPRLACAWMPKRWRYRAYNDHESKRHLTRRLRGRLTAIPRGHQGALPTSNPPGVLLHSQKPPVKWCGRQWPVIETEQMELAVSSRAKVRSPSLWENTSINRNNNRECTCTWL